MKVFTKTATEKNKETNTEIRKFGKNAERGIKPRQRKRQNKRKDTAKLVPDSRALFPKAYRPRGGG